MIVSLTLPYDITPRILHLITSISEKFGEASAYHIDKPSLQLRKLSRIKTIHASLSIEGNALSKLPFFMREISLVRGA
jgi:hypothetical protein